MFVDSDEHRTERRAGKTEYPCTKVTSEPSDPQQMSSFNQEDHAAKVQAQAKAQAQAQAQKQQSHTQNHGHPHAHHNAHVLQLQRPKPLTQQERERIFAYRDKYYYSPRYSDDEYEYRHVALPRDMLKVIPSDYFSDKGTFKILAEEEWRTQLGITQSLGWVHYGCHAPEPHILLFRKPKA